jgi:hypothetical protein
MHFLWQNVEGWQCPDLVGVTILDEDEATFLYDTKAGLALEQPLPEITFRVDTFEGLEGRDSLWDGFPYLVFSPRLRAALAAAGVTNVEYYPARISNRQTGEVLTDFLIANIVGLAFCMDWERSIYVPEEGLPGYVEEVSRLVLDSGKVPEHLLMFRLGELSTKLLCHRRVSEALTEQGIVGVRFEEVEIFPPQ